MGGIFLILVSLIQASPDELIPDTTVLKPLSGKKILYILPHNGFRDEEYVISRDMLENSGATIVVASSDTSMAKGMIKQKVKPDILIDSLIHPGDYAALLFIGGVGAREYWNNKFLHAIADTAIRKKKVVGAICIAPIILARAGLLANCKATVWRDKETRNIFDSESVNYTGRDVETNGTIVTASMPEVVKPWTEEIMRVLLKGSMLQQKEMIDTRLPEPGK